MDLANSPLRSLAQLIATFLPWTILLSSFLGSTHCASMCGGLVLAIAPTWQKIFFYQMGRLLSYLILGIIVFELGESFLNSNIVIIQWIAAIGIAAILVFSGLNLFGAVGLRYTWPSVLQRPLLWATGIARRGNQNTLGAFYTGLFSAFLPCGWLYVNLVAVITLETLPQKLLGMTFFWIGTLPALTIFPLVARRFFGRAPIVFRKVTGLFLIILGLATVAVKMYPSPSEKTCHSTSNIR